MFQERERGAIISEGNQTLSRSCPGTSSCSWGRSMMNPRNKPPGHQLTRLDEETPEWVCAGHLRELRQSAWVWRASLWRVATKCPSFTSQCWTTKGRDREEKGHTCARVCAMCCTITYILDYMEFFKCIVVLNYLELFLSSNKLKPRTLLRIITELMNLSVSLK